MIQTGEKFLSFFGNVKKLRFKEIICLTITKILKSILNFFKNLGVIGSSVRWVETLRTTEWNICQTGRS